MKAIVILGAIVWAIAWIYIKSKETEVERFYKRYKNNLYIGDKVTYRYGKEGEFLSGGKIENVKISKNGGIEYFNIYKGDNWEQGCTNVQNIITVNGIEKEYVIDHRILEKKYSLTSGILSFIVIGILGAIFSYQ